MWFKFKRTLPKVILTGLACFIVFVSTTLIHASSTEDYSGYIEISDAEDLQAVADDPYGKYVLTSDISLRGIDWYPLNFYGIFDGNGYTIYDLNSTQLNSETNITVDGNAKKYDTYFSGLFGQVKDAIIKNLNMKACNIQINSDKKNCFAACIAGYMENTEIINCNTQGYVYLYGENIMCGVAGIAGFGYGTITDCQTDVTLVFVDGNEASIKCEQFLGGILATGYTDIENCDVNIKGYASMHGYAHNGGLVGMYYVHTSDTQHKGYVRNSNVNGYISFFEKNTNRRAYCDAYVGEILDGFVSVSDNTNSFLRDERFDYSVTLLPNPCENPIYTETETGPTFTDMGYTTYKCETCEYSYVADYTFTIKRLSEFKKELNLKLNSTYKLESGINTENELIWYSSDKSVVKVDDTGKITATGYGNAIISCSLPNGTSLGECSVTVKSFIWEWVISIFIILFVISISVFILRRYKFKSKN